MMNISRLILLSRGKDSEGQEVTRPYTPITLDSQDGYFELVVKVNISNYLSIHSYMCVCACVTGRSYIVWVKKTSSPAPTRYKRPACHPTPILHMHCCMI